LVAAGFPSVVLALHDDNTCDQQLNEILKIDVHLTIVANCKNLIILAFSIWERISTPWHSFSLVFRLVMAPFLLG
jgi:hypothetical protein